MEVFHRVWCSKGCFVYLAQRKISLNPVLLYGVGKAVVEEVPFEKTPMAYEWFHRPPDRFITFSPRMREVLFAFEELVEHGFSGLRHDGGDIDLARCAARLANGRKKQPSKGVAHEDRLIVGADSVCKRLSSSLNTVRPRDLVKAVDATSMTKIP